MEFISYLTGKSAGDKSDQTEQLLIKLGAKPVTKKGKNYRLVLEDRRKLKANGVNTRCLFGTSDSLQYRSQKQPSTHKKSNKNDALLKRYGKIEKSDRKHIKKPFKKPN